MVSVSSSGFPVRFTRRFPRRSKFITVSRVSRGFSRFLTVSITFHRGCVSCVSCVFGGCLGLLDDFLGFSRLLPVPLAFDGIHGFPRVLHFCVTSVLSGGCSRFLSASHGHLRLLAFPMVSHNFSRSSRFLTVARGFCAWVTFPACFPGSGGCARFLSASLGCIRLHSLSSLSSVFHNVCVFLRSS